MKKLLFFLFLISVSCAFAQSKFIEVEVRDTVALKPASFKCVISVSGSYDAGENTIDNSKPFDEKEYTKSVLQNLERIKTELKQKKYNFKTDDGINLYPPLSALSNGSIIVNLTTAKQLEELNVLMAQFEFAATRVKDIVYVDRDKAEMRLLKKIIDKAKVKADVIAGYSGLKLGRIIEVKESKEIDDLTINIGAAYYVMENGNDPLNGKLSKALTVKFMAE